MKTVAALRFMFRNGETWTVDSKYIGDLWIKHITTSYGRINGGDFEEIHPCESLKIEIFQEADHVVSEDINLGGLELGMFDRVNKYNDIELMDILYSREGSQVIVSSDRVYFPFSPLDVDGNDNKYQSSKIGQHGRLLLTIDPDKTVDDVYPEN